MNIYFMLTDIFASFYCHEDAHIIGSTELVSISRERNRSSETRTMLTYIYRIKEITDSSIMILLMWWQVTKPLLALST